MKQRISLQHILKTMDTIPDFDQQKRQFEYLNRQYARQEGLSFEEAKKRYQLYRITNGIKG